MWLLYFALLIQDVVYVMAQSLVTQDFKVLLLDRCWHSHIHWEGFVRKQMTEPHPDTL